jgi:hypothetical protein
MRAARFSLLVLSMLATALCGCNDQRLAGNFKMTWMNSCEVVIHAPQHITETTQPDGTKEPVLRENMVGGKVQTFAVKDPYITGYATIGCDPDVGKEGYFLIDSGSEEIVDGMDETRWNDELTKVGWPHPNLKRPICVFRCW